MAPGSPPAGATVYRSVTAQRFGPPEVLQVVEHPLRPPAKGEARLRVLAAAVCRPDLTARAGRALYSGTPLGQKLPFTPGYAVIGQVEALGEAASGVRPGDRVAALTVIGGCSEVLYWRADRLIPVPAGLDPGEAVPLVLNYIVAYQALHRSARVRPGETALIIGASGGIGTALLQLGRLAGLKLYGAASASKHPVLVEHGAVPVDYRTQDIGAVVRRAEPDGIDVVLDGVMQPETVRTGLGLLRRGGRLVAFGEPAGFGSLFRVLGLVLAANLRPDGRRAVLYGTSTYFLGDRRPYLEDWAALFTLLQQGKICPVIAAKFPLLEAAQAHALLESGTVVGNVVLVSPELL